VTVKVELYITALSSIFNICVITKFIHPPKTLRSLPDHSENIENCQIFYKKFIQKTHLHTKQIYNKSNRIYYETYVHITHKEI